MCIYCNTSNYRKIYQHHYGPIPKEPDGRSYDIHHIDGDRTNNAPDNLVALTIQQHYDIHYAQGDLMACWKIAGKMSVDPVIQSTLSTQYNLQRVANGTHPFIGGEVSRRTNAMRVQNGTHNLLGKNNPSHKRIKDGTHNFLDPEFRRKHQEEQHRLVKEGKHVLQNKQWARERNLKRLADGKDPSQVHWTCPHCNKSGRGTGAYAKWHGDNCRTKAT